MPTDLDTDRSSNERASLLARIRELEQRLADAEETLGAIRHGEVDALVVNSSGGEHLVFTLESTDRPYQLLIEQMQEGAVTLRVDGTVMYGNRGLAQILGTVPERIIGRNLHQFVHPAGDAGLRRLLKEAERGGVRRELTLRAANGRKVSVHVSLNPMRGTNPVLLVGVVTDLTDQKAHVQALAEANDRLVNEIAERERAEDALRHAQKMEVIGQLTGGIAHDFNNMLQGIMGGIALAQKQIQSGRPDDATKYFASALGSAERAATLTRRLLSFGRRQTLSPKLVVLHELIGGMESLIQRSAGPSVDIALHLTEECWPVRCDPNQLESALLNLAINARDALLPAGGELSIETTHVVLDEASTSRWEEADPGEYVCITVTDNGVGMPPDVLEHAFEPFFTTKPDGQGTGLGLSQIYGFARQSNGFVRLESQLGVGTSVRLYLPRGLADDADTREGTVPAALQLQPQMVVPGTVLLVEDEELIRGTAAEVLREIGYQVLEAEDGAAGLRMLQAMQGADLSLLVTDIGLPGGLNGRQLADAARAMRANLPILLISGYGGEALLRRGPLDPGMTILAKPFTFEALVDRVRGMIEPGQKS